MSVPRPPHSYRLLCPFVHRVQIAVDSGRDSDKGDCIVPRRLLCAEPHPRYFILRTLAAISAVLTGYLPVRCTAGEYRSR
jgi:hypothetical protein